MKGKKNKGFSCRDDWSLLCPGIRAKPLLRNSFRGSFKDLDRTERKDLTKKIFSHSRFKNKSINSVRIFFSKRSSCSLGINNRMREGIGSKTIFLLTTCCNIVPCFFIPFSFIFYLSLLLSSRYV